MVKSRSLSLSTLLLVLSASVLIRPALLWQLEFLQDYLLIPLLVFLGLLMNGFIKRDKGTLFLIFTLGCLIILVSRIPIIELRLRWNDPLPPEIKFDNTTLRLAEGQRESQAPFSWYDEATRITISSPVNAVLIRNSVGNDLPPVLQITFEPKEQGGDQLSLLHLPRFSSGYGRQQERVLIRRFCSQVRHHNEEVKVLVKTPHSIFAPVLEMLKHRCAVTRERGVFLSQLLPGNHYYLYSRAR